MISLMSEKIKIWSKPQIKDIVIDLNIDSGSCYDGSHCQVQICDVDP